MQVEQTEIESISKQLDAAKANGQNWVVFNNNENHTPDWMKYRFFSSAAEAEENCSGRNYPPDYYDQPDYGYEVIHFDDEAPDYRFMAIDTMQRLLEPPALNHKPLEMPINTIVELMDRQSVHLLPGGRYDQLLATFQKEELFPVEWIKPVIPEQEVAQFHVVEHEHAGHQVYEIGHRHRVLESFSSFEQAHRYMEHCVSLSGAMGERPDYLLIGQYHNKPCRLDMEGAPEANCGLTFLTANFQYNTETKEREYVWHQIHSLQGPANIHQYMFAKYNVADGQLQLYNDRLQPADPRAYLVSVYPAHFNNDPITIKHSIIMNEKNLDYLKEELKYRGFSKEVGEELEKNIRAGLSEFVLAPTNKIDGNTLEHQLQYRKGDINETYFFNTMTTTLKSPGENEQGIAQTFYGNENITAKEAYNLLSGRAVNKTYHIYEKVGEGEKPEYKWTPDTYNTWLQLNFNAKDKHGNFEVEKFSEKYGFDVEKSLKQIPLKEVGDWETEERMVKALKKGDIVEGTMERNSVIEKVYVKANPKARVNSVYDSEGNRLSKEDLKVAKSNRVATHEDVAEDVKKKHQLDNQRVDESTKQQNKKNGIKQ
jgi:hypothetical protein